jgi:outer membrane lipoprotein-sorting protein
MKELKLTLIIIFSYFFFINIAHPNIKEKIINKLEETKTLSFNFTQKIGEKEEKGNCYIKYPLLMKCNYQNAKQKILISNGNTVAIIKKKYKKIYYYPIKATPLFTILNKEKILNLIKHNDPHNNRPGVITFEFFDKKLNKLKIFFDKNSLEFKGWETKDTYSNDVIFTIIDLKTNKVMKSQFFTIPKEEDL